MYINVSGPTVMHKNLLVYLAVQNEKLSDMFCKLRRCISLAIKSVLKQNTRP